MNELSQRLNEAVEFLKKNGYARSDAAIGRTIGVAPNTFNMAKKGERTPTWGMLLDLCDNYPINFWWLRSGEGDMIGNGDRVLSLLRKIRDLESRIKELDG